MATSIIKDLSKWDAIIVSDWGKMESLQVRKNGDMLYINLVSNGTTIAENETLFTLPTEARPISNQRFMVWSYNADKVYMIMVLTDGSVKLYGKGSVSVGSKLVGSAVIYLGF